MGCNGGGHAVEYDYGPVIPGRLHYTDLTNCMARNSINSVLDLSMKVKPGMIPETKFFGVYESSLGEMEVYILPNGRLRALAVDSIESETLNLAELVNMNFGIFINVKSYLMDLFGKHRNY